LTNWYTDGFNKGRLPATATGFWRNDMHGLIGWGAARRWGAGVLVLAAAVAAQAVPLQSDERSAMVGGTVTPLFNIHALEGGELADFTVSFDPTYLSFKGCTDPFGTVSGTGVPDCAGIGYDTGLGTGFAFAEQPSASGQFFVSLSADPTTSGIDVHLFNLLFDIIGRPTSGTTDVTIVRREAAQGFDPVTPEFDPVVATITIPEAPITIPVAGSQWLALTALALLPLGRRFRRRADPSSTGV
jgi:hypothetical protein